MSTAAEARHLVETVYPTVANSGDADAYAALYTSDALWSPPEAPDRRGPAGIRFGYIAKNADIDARMHVDDVRVMGEFAYVTALARVLILPRVGPGRITHFYRGTWLLRLESGVWKIHRQTWTPKPADQVRAVFEPPHAMAATD